MKKLLTTLTILFLISCGGGDDLPPGHIVPPTVIDNPTPEPDPEPTIKKIKLMVKTQTAVKFYNGESVKLFKTGVSRYIAPGIISVDDIVYWLDEYGEITQTQQTIVIPTKIKIINTDIWICETIPAADAFAMGALFKDYTRIWKNATEQGNWFLNQWIAKNLVLTQSQDLIAINATDSKHHVNGNYTIIFYAGENDLLIYDFNAVGRTAKIKTDTIYNVTWNQNYITNSFSWQNGLSNNGYEFDGVLSENANALFEFNSLPFPVTIPAGEYPYVIASGTRLENSENIYYWIECNTGWLFRYVPSLDKLEIKYRLYSGNGYRATGIAYSTTLKPVIIENWLYFYDSGSIWRIDLNTGVVENFYSGNVEIWRF